ncbi:MAG TPA: chemotaxis protein CheX [Bryobacteraceae bacterium]|nr:chemotaxis protein CheX [Bryobacteraceae bacterium]
MTEQLLHRDELMAAEMVGAARDVLNVMFFTDILEEGEECACPQPFPIQVRVTFTGDQSGEFRLAVDDLAAGSLAGSFLGTDPVAGPNEVEVEQVMGELGNMICGAFLSRFEKEGLFALSSPEVIRPAIGEIPGIHRGLELMDGFMDLRVCWGTIPG